MMRFAFSSVLALVLVGAAVASADDVTDAIARADAAYGLSDYKGASVELQKALVGVNRKLAGLIIAAMPGPPPGWTAGEPRGLDPSLLGLEFLAGLLVERIYTAPNGHAIEMTVAANSPLLATFRMFIANPMLAASMGAEGDMKPVRVCGCDGIEQFTSEATDLEILAGSTTLISVSGEDASDREHVRTLANATDCRGIVSIVE